MNEDDTFRVLARPDIDKMVDLYWESGLYRRDRISTDRIKFVKYYGWGWAEFLKAKKEAGYTGF